MKTITENQLQELDAKLEAFEKRINLSIELNGENSKKQWNDGEYSYIVEESSVENINTIPLSEELGKALTRSSISKETMIQEIIEDGNFKMKYEEQFSPFQYGSPYENEIQVINVGGDQSMQEDLDSVLEFKPLFNLNEYFETFSDFEKFVRYEIGSIDYLKHFWEFFVENKTHINVTFNTDYDIVRVLIDDEESVIKKLQENPKPKEKFIPKILKITESEYRELSESHSGFCLKCGKINEGFHEPDAREYKCNHCETDNSYGIEECIIMMNVELVNEDESELDQAYD
jgi:hypothetical protein